MQPQRCHFCGHTVSLVHVHGHYQCPVCHTNALPCCDGDNCDTNLLLTPMIQHINTAKHSQQTIELQYLRKDVHLKSEI